MKQLLNQCGCGCGTLVEFRFKRGHGSRMTNTAELAARAAKFATMRGKKHTPESKAKISANKKAFYANGGQAWNKGLTKDLHPSVGLNNRGQYQSAADHYDRSFPTTSTTLEAIFQIALWERGIPFLFNVPIRHICRPDFLFPDAWIVVNLDGAYWHRNRKDKDALQDNALEAEGWLVFRFSEEQVRKNLELVLSEVENAYRSRSVNKSHV